MYTPTAAADDDDDDNGGGSYDVDVDLVFFHTSFVQLFQEFNNTSMLVFIHSSSQCNFLLPEIISITINFMVMCAQSMLQIYCHVTWVVHYALMWVVAAAAVSCCCFLLYFFGGLMLICFVIKDTRQWWKQKLPHCAYQKEEKLLHQVAFSNS